MPHGVKKNLPPKWLTTPPPLDFDFNHMGSALSTVAPRPTVPIDAYIAELGDLTYNTDLGRGGRFLKSVRATHRDAEAVVKVLIKPPPGLDLTVTRQQLVKLKEALKDNNGAISYSRIVETDRAGYLVRQYIKHNLYDRISNRPFLEPIEKKWLVFQLLMCLKHVHARNFCHGDIKSENVLVTSWKWVYLVDWAPFKPVSLPENDSAQFLYFFDTSQRRSCYVAPERFGDSSELTPEMDIYSTGCVVAELFCDGKPLFTLADLFKYRREEYTPNLDAIDDENVRQLIYSMISLKSSDRQSAEHYLEQYRGTLFPEYFWQFYALMERFSGSSENPSDEIIQAVSDAFPDICRGLDVSVPKQASAELRQSDLFKVSLHKCWIPERAETVQPGALLILSLVCSVLKSTQTASRRLLALNLIMALAQYVPVDAILDRCLPYLVSMLPAKDFLVQTTSLRALTHLLTMVDRLTPLNEQLFSEYLFPQLRSVLASPDPQVRAIYAKCLPIIVERAMALSEDDAASHAQIEDQIRALVVEKDVAVRVAFLENADSLCVAMGRTKANDIVLSHVLTYFNKKDPRLLVAIFEFFSKVGPLLGPASLESYAIPLIQLNLVEWRDEVVVSAALLSLANLAQLGAIRLPMLWNIVSAGIKFFVHPNPDIRAKAFLLVSSAARHMSSAQIYCLLAPMLAPLLETEVSDYKSHRALIAAAKTPMARPVYNLCLTWAAQTREDTFWRRKETAFSPEDRRWLERLRDVGFNNEDLWQIIVLKDYIRQVALPASQAEETNSLEDALLNVTLQSWSGEETPTPELEKYLRVHSRDDENRHLLEVTPDSIRGSPSPAKDAPILSGTLVTSIKAHRGAIKSLAIPASNAFFVTGAADGFVKVWDVASLRKGTSRPSSLLDLGSPVTALTFFDSAGRFCVAGTLDGTLHFLEYVEPDASEDGPFTPNILGSAGASESKRTRQATLKITRTLSLNDYAVSLYHHRQVLYVLGANCIISLVDLADGDRITELACPVEHGVATCWVFDRAHQWVAVGTSHGIIELWDLRFQLLVQSFGVGDLLPITSIALHPNPALTWVFVGGGFARPLISAWDIQTAECRKLLVPVSAGEPPLPSLMPVTDLADRLASWTVNEDVPYISLATFPTNGLDHRILTAGSDRVIRQWNLNQPNLSTVVSGINYTRPLPVYSGRMGSDVSYIFERQSAPKRPDRPSRVTAITKEEADIGRNHRGTITRIGVLYMQREIIVSADEVGYVKVYV